MAKTGGLGDCIMSLRLYKYDQDFCSWTVFETTCQTTLTCANIDQDHEKNPTKEYQQLSMCFYLFLIILICSMTFNEIYFAHQIKNKSHSKSKLLFVLKV